MEILDALNAAQREAVVHPGGPLLIFAGAGTGKTRVLTHRVAYLIRACGVEPRRILAVTFTNKAAREMKERIVRLVGPTASGIWMGTFHALCARLLRIHGYHIGLDSNFAIYDEQDQQQVLKECLRALNVDEKQNAPYAILREISRAKERLVPPEEYARAASGGFENTVAKVYPLYVARLRHNHALDFDDLIAFAVQLLHEVPEVREQVQERFHHVLVDEFQDVNYSQYVWTRLIAKKHQNLTVVGDDDQSIYAWRGADVRLILSFESDFPGAKVVKLEQNYRSTPSILDAAYSVVSRNKNRAEKRLWTNRADRGKVQLFQALNEYEEARYVALKVATDYAARTRRYSDFAVLYRMNAQSRPFEDELRRNGIPYRVVGGLRFYDRKEIKDLIAYLRLLANPADGVSLRRVLGIVPRGIGASTLARLEAYGGARGLSLFDAMHQATGVPGIAPAILRKIKEFLGVVEELRALVDRVSVAELLQAIIQRTRFEESLEDGSSVETLSRKANVEELVNVAREFGPLDQEHTLSAFLEQLALVSDVDRLKEDEDGVVL
ncbi:MAG: UvrD-helicase domain-containing protein, partial [Armatimonadota bacterium]|nr:UvrD-helicase domain-containing protein [Armatimonadota bacterium]